MSLSNKYEAADILTVIAKRDREPKKKKTQKTVKRYRVCVGSASAMRSRSVYTYAGARRLAARARRFGLDAYVSCPFMLTIES